MPFYPQQNNTFQAKPSATGYDLESEKQRIALGAEEMKKDLFENWRKSYANAQIFPAKLAQVNPELVEFILSFKNTLFYNDLVKKFGFSQEQRDALPQIVWNVSLAKNWYGLESLLQSELKINPSTAGQVAILINQNILFKAKELGEKVFVPKRFLAENKEEQGTEKISIQEAIKNYPELGEQLITSERIILKSFPGPVRPSIKNWLADYNFVMGYEKERSGIERTNYLFHNINTQKLNPAEREHLSLILKSHDENYPLTVNKHTRQVVFPQIAPRPMPASPQIKQSLAQDVSQSALRPSQKAVPHLIFQTATQRPVIQPTPLPRPNVLPAQPIQTAKAPAKIEFRKNTTQPDQQTPASHAGKKSSAGKSFFKTLFRSSQPTQPTAPLPQGRLEIKEPPRAPKKDDSGVHFSSAQILPVEKENDENKDGLQPYRITPFGASANEKLPEEKVASTKNVINLKE